MASAAARRRLGRILIGLGLLLLIAALAFGGGFVPLPPPGKEIVAAVLALAGVVKLTVGVKALRGAGS